MVNLETSLVDARDQAWPVYCPLQRFRMNPDALSQPSDAEPTVLDTEPLYNPPDLIHVTGEPVALAAKKPDALPVSSSERYFAVDVLRGFALLGILAMNIVSFGWPWPAYGNPMRGGGFQGFDRVVWLFNHLAFEEKMMTIFSMLFGAGLVLMDQRAEARGRISAASTIDESSGCWRSVSFIRT